jgi:hypothetical protein
LTNTCLGRCEGLTFNLAKPNKVSNLADFHIFWDDAAFWYGILSEHDQPIRSLNSFCPICKNDILIF